tara:strand:+ start:1366 stop:2439 length:1074 start_codon:yes stop_codon:yes gene_type:complete
MAYTTVDDATIYFSTTLYTGDGQQNRAVTIDGTGMQPNMLWIKSRSLGEQHVLGDSVRGATKKIIPSSNEAESTSATNIASFTSTGFTVANGGVDGAVNQNGATYVSWAWKTDTSFTNDASGTGIGTIDSTGSFSNDSGFSIVTYTGTGSDGTIKHGLNAKPKIVIWKRLDNAAGAVNWIVQSTILGNQTKLVLNTTEATSTNSSFSQTDNWTSALLDLKTYEGQNASNGTYVAYCFVEKQGFSSIGTYIGNGNNDGTFAYTGFRPAFVMIKKAIGSTENWYMVDNKRNTFNIVNNFIKANTGNAGNTSSGSFNFFSNGFKNNDANGGQNESGHTYLYMAFAENPFVTSTGIPTNAR